MESRGPRFFFAWLKPVEFNTFFGAIATWFCFKKYITLRTFQQTPKGAWAPKPPGPTVYDKEFLNHLGVF